MSFIDIEKGNQNNYTSKIRIDKKKDIVEKIIDYGEYSDELFKREIYWLTILHDTDIVPKLKSCNPITHTITMNWCGDILSEDNKPDNLYEQLFNINLILLKNNCFYNDWKAGNLLVKDNKITLIDFGWCPRIIEDYSCDKEVKTQLTEKPSGNYFKDIFKGQLMSNVKLLDLNKDWQQVRPTLNKVGDYFSITGYQDYNISKIKIVPISDNIKTKLSLMKSTIQSDILGKTISDIGCSNMFFGFLSYFYGATNVIGIDLDTDYLKQNNHLINQLLMKNVSCENINVVDYKTPADTVFAFAIIHWIYSCSGFLGSLENVVKHLKSITNKCLYVEWIDPSDDCISAMLHHIDFNKDLTKQDYNKDNFVKYLQDNFSSISYLGVSKQSGTREIYRCVI